VEPDREEKSISAEETYDTDIRAASELQAQLVHLGGSHRIPLEGAKAPCRPG